LDILINNAGVAAKGDAFDQEIAKWTIGTNYFGLVRVTNTLLPIMRPGGRVVSIGSTSGNLSKLTSDALRARFLDENQTEAGVTELMHTFIRAVGEGNYAEKGWPRQTYAVSKMGVHAYTRALARHARSDIDYFCCCPGWCRTDMAGPNAPLSAEEGSDTPVFLALTDDPEVLKHRGKFFSKRRCDESGNY
jgi:carbonyl reductase 1